MDAEFVFHVDNTISIVIIQEIFDELYYFFFCSLLS